MRKAREREEVLAGFFEAGGNGWALQPPFPEEGLTTGFNLLGRLGVDHVGVTIGEFFVQALRRMSQEVAMLMHRAALDRDVGPERRQGGVEAGSAVHDHQVRGLQAPLGEIVEQRPPSRLAFSAHVFRGQ